MAIFLIFTYAQKQLSENTLDKRHFQPVSVKWFFIMYKITPPLSSWCKNIDLVPVSFPYFSFPLNMITRDGSAVSRFSSAEKWLGWHFASPFIWFVASSVPASQWFFKDGTGAQPAGGSKERGSGSFENHFLSLELTLQYRVERIKDYTQIFFSKQTELSNAAGHT